MTYDDRRHIRTKALELALQWQKNHAINAQGATLMPEALKMDELLATAGLFENYITGRRQR